jgi:hypothetical protein
MGALGDVLIWGVVGFFVIAGLSLLTMGDPATPPFARRTPTASSPQLRQDPDAGFPWDRGFLLSGLGFAAQSEICLMSEGRYV